MSYMPMTSDIARDNGVRELTIEEMDEVSGALGPLVIVAIAIAAPVAIVAVSNFVAGVVDGASHAERQN